MTRKYDPRDVVMTFNGQHIIGFDAAHPRIMVYGVVDNDEPRKLTRAEIFDRVKRSGEPRELCPCGYCAKVSDAIKALGFDSFDALKLDEIKAMRRRGTIAKGRNP